MFSSDGSNTTLHRVLRNAQTNAQKWNDLLHTSGGALELSKCSCHVLYWLFSAQGAPVLAPRIADDQEVLKVIDQTTNFNHNLELLSPYQAHKTLGHYKDPAGIQAEQFRRLKQKSDELTSFLWRCPLTKLEAWTFYFACYLPSVGYPLSCSSLSRERLDHVQRKAMSIIVPRCGFNRNTKRDILYGPIELGGANFRHLYVEQGIGQVGLFIKNWRQNTTSGKLLRIAVGWFQVQVGTSYSFLGNGTASLPHLESKWLLSLRTFLASIDSFLQLDNAGIQELQRHHDSHIMDSILTSGKFTPTEIRRLNYCRLYLQAQTIADLATLTGDSLDNGKLSGQMSDVSSITQGHQIHQQRPSDQEWKLWRKANRLWSTDTGKLYQPLGPWLHPIKEQRQRHHAYRYKHRLWVRDTGNYAQCILVDGERGLYEHTGRSCSWHDIVDDSLPVVAIPTSSSLWRIKRSTTFVPIPRRTINPATFDQYVNNLEPWEAELLSYMELSSDAFTVSEALSHGV